MKSASSLLLAEKRQLVERKLVDTIISRMKEWLYVRYNYITVVFLSINNLFLSVVVIIGIEIFEWVLSRIKGFKRSLKMFIKVIYQIVGLSNTDPILKSTFYLKIHRANVFRESGMSVKTLQTINVHMYEL